MLLCSVVVWLCVLCVCVCVWQVVGDTNLDVADSAKEMMPAGWSMIGKSKDFGFVKGASVANAPCADLLAVRSQHTRVPMRITRAATEEDGPWPVPSHRYAEEAERLLRKADSAAAAAADEQRDDDRREEPHEPSASAGAAAGSSAAGEPNEPSAGEGDKKN